MPLISVIIPAYNAEKTIQSTINSVLQQTFPDFELIVINDNSSDATLDVVKSIQDERLKVFTYSSGSASGSRNHGIAHASGEFIAFLDSDDIWTPDKLEVQLKALQDNCQAAVAYCWVDRINEFGEFIGSGSRFNKSGDILADLLMGNFLDNGSNPLIRTQALTKVGEFDESLSNGEDWDLYLRLAAQYQFVCVPHPHVLYRVSQKSKSHRNLLKSEASYLKYMEKAYARAPISLQHLKKEGFSSYYRFIILKALNNSKIEQRKTIALKLLWHYVINAPGRFEHIRVKVSLFKKILKLYVSDFSDSFLWVKNNIK